MKGRQERRCRRDPGEADPGKSKQWWTADGTGVNGQAAGADRSRRPRRLRPWRGKQAGGWRGRGEAGAGRQAGEGLLAPAWSSALLCSSCPGPRPLARRPSARGFEEPPSCPPGLVRACERCLSRGGVRRAGSVPRLPHGLPAQAAASLPARLRRHILLPPPPPPPPGAAAVQSRLLSAPCDVAALQALSSPAGREAPCSALPRGREGGKEGERRRVQPGSYRLRLRLTHCAAAILVSPLTGGAGSPSQQRHGPPASI
ncbi:protein FAM246B-like [Apus apus]|uniref:protein FAM246B-like n=1 Tax=Apus apus TaxID=8895 RepID=UPI0021F84B33|nr:protein FAM246B-like [Apus apus]